MNKYPKRYIPKHLSAKDKLSIKTAEQIKKNV